MKTLQQLNNNLLKDLELHLLINIHHYYEEQGEEFRDIESLLKTVIQYYNYALESFVLYRRTFDEYTKFIHSCPNNNGVIDLKGELIDEYKKIQNRETSCVFSIYAFVIVAVKNIRLLKKFALKTGNENELKKEIITLAKKSEKRMKEIIDNRNNIIIHPTNENQQDGIDQFIVSSKSESSCYYDQSTFIFEKRSLNNSFKTEEFELNLYEDLKFIRNYIEKMGQLLSKYLKLISQNNIPPETL